MSTLLEATQRYSVNIEGYIVLDPNGAWVRFADIEQAIAQEQRNKNAVPLDMVRFGGRCNIHPLNVLPCTACEGILQRKQASKDVAQIIGNLDAKMHKSFSNWEPKP